MRFVVAACFLWLGCQNTPEEFPLSQCPVLTQNLPGTESEAASQKSTGKVFSNRDIRARYLCDVAKIGPQDEALRAKGATAEERARSAYELRKNARKAARAMMTNEAEVAALKARDTEKYGNPDGPTFDWLIEKAKKKGLTGDAIFQEIIESAQRTNADVNKALGL